MNDIRCELPDAEPLSEEIAIILGGSGKIAVVGLSPKEERDSHRVARYLIEQGYEIVPVNPGQTEILGRKCFKSLKEIPFPVHVVDLFLNPDRIPPVVDQAIQIGAGVVWMQLGIVHNQAARKARQAGLTVVMNRCIKQEHEKMRCAESLPGTPSQHP